MKNLILHIEQIKEKSLALKFEEGPQTFPVLKEMAQTEECIFLDPIKLSLNAVRIGALVEVKGDFHTTVRLVCGRCLREFETSLKSRFSLIYAKQLPGQGEDSDQEEVELSAQEIGLIYFRGEEINLQDGIQEQVVMAFPLRPLCSEDCKGLCPICGTDLNNDNCSCRRNAANSKFAVLKDLKIDKTV
jgi:uncharacterized protein